MKHLAHHITLFLLMFSVLPLMGAPKQKSAFQKGQTYFFQKKYEMAELLLQEAVKKEPENARAFSYLGDIFLHKKRYNGALNLYKKSIAIDPNVAENHFRLGQVYYYKKLGDLAIENFRQALKLDKSLTFAHYHIGLCQLMLMRNKKETIASWETYISAAPEDPQYESIRRVIELLRDPNFVIPPAGSDVSIEEALLLGGSTLTKTERTAKDRKAGNENKKTKEKLEDLYLDDDL